MPAVESDPRGERAVKLVFAPHELADMQPVIDAVCGELGVTSGEQARRRAVAERVMDAYRRGSRQPLNMVHAGLAEAAMPAPQP